ncbi:MAG TPA: squalene synthase HpnC [Rhodocyclaceae bacterium]|nr:squalene synthase HpnC [Rhodocyclaceae bacterium]
MTNSHYENFPVASVVLPAALREPVAAIYAFARSADDFADEGNLTTAKRLALLDDYQHRLDTIEDGLPIGDPLFKRLADVIAEFDLPMHPFRDLLDAFSQDVVQTRYATYAELLDYCRRSANPVGRLLLQLFKATTPDNVARSDAICTALQLINHWQDVGVDATKPEPRIYLPGEDLAYFGVPEIDILRRTTTADFRSLMRFQVERTRQLMMHGERLGWSLPGRVGLEIRMIIAGGLRILEKIEDVDYDVFRHRPVLTATDWPRLLWRAI